MTAVLSRVGDHFVGIRNIGVGIGIIGVSMCLLFVVRAPAARGELVYRVSGCDYFVVVTANGYDVLEWYGGHDPDKGDILTGNYDTYGMHNIYDETADEEVNVWVEDYGLSKTDALEKLTDKCD